MQKKDQELLISSLDNTSKSALPKANLKHLYELMDLHISIYEYLKQMYMLEFNLEDDEMIRELKLNENEMSWILMQVSSGI